MSLYLDSIHKNQFFVGKVPVSAQKKIHVLTVSGNAGDNTEFILYRSKYLNNQMLQNGFEPFVSTNFFEMVMPRRNSKTHFSVKKEQDMLYHLYLNGSRVYFNPIHKHELFLDPLAPAILTDGTTNEVEPDTCHGYNTFHGIVPSNEEFKEDPLVESILKTESIKLKEEEEKKKDVNQFPFGEIEIKKKRGRKAIQKNDVSIPDVETSQIENVETPKVENVEVVENIETIKSLETSETENVETPKVENVEVVETVESLETSETENVESLQTETIESLETSETENVKTVESLETENIETIESLETENIETIESSEIENVETIESLETENVETVESLETENVEVVETIEERPIIVEHIEPEIPKVEKKVHFDLEDNTKSRVETVIETMSQIEKEKKELEELKNNNQFMKILQDYNEMKIENSNNQEIYEVSQNQQQEEVRQLISYIEFQHQMKTYRMPCMKLQTSEMVDFKNIYIQPVLQSNKVDRMNMAVNVPELNKYYLMSHMNQKYLFYRNAQALIITNIQNRNTKMIRNKEIFKLGNNDYLLTNQCSMLVPMETKKYFDNSYGTTKNFFIPKMA